MKRRQDLLAFSATASSAVKDRIRCCHRRGIKYPWRCKQDLVLGSRGGTHHGQDKCKCLGGFRLPGWIYLGLMPHFTLLPCSPKIERCRYRYMSQQGTPPLPSLALTEPSPIPQEGASFIPVGSWAQGGQAYFLIRCALLPTPLLEGVFLDTLE